MKILILYAELMPYTIAVCEALVKYHNVELKIINWDQKKQTPYCYDSENSNIKIYARSKFNLASMIEFSVTFNPDLICVSGRMDKTYLSVCRYFKNKIPTVMMTDQQWIGSFKNHVAVLLQKQLYHRYFSHAWVPGNFQYEYARRVGFTRESIIKNCLSADTNTFQPQIKYPKKTNNILFVGRLNKVKGLDQLIICLEELRNKGIFTGKLVIFGNGVLDKLFNDYDFIDYRGFANQKEIKGIINEVDFFCLPSVWEPWGLVIHEMASLGLPILCSNCCGAATEFVINGFNGYTFSSGNWKELGERLVLMLNNDITDQMNYSKNSIELGSRISPRISAASIYSLLK